MYYFDNEYLRQYLQTGQTVSVMVNKEYLVVADEADVESPEEGIGYNTYGKPQRFNYKAVEAIKIGSNIYTLDQLNQKMDPKAEPEKKSKDDAEPKAGEDDITIDPDKDSKEKKESISKHDYIINLDPKSPYYSTKGSVVSINDGVVVYQTYADNSFIKVSCLLEHVRKE